MWQRISERPHNTHSSTHTQSFVFLVAQRYKTVKLHKPFVQHSVDYDEQTIVSFVCVCVWTFRFGVFIVWSHVVFCGVIACKTCAPFHSQHHVVLAFCLHCVLFTGEIECTTISEHHSFSIFLSLFRSHRHFPFRQNPATGMGFSF